MTDKILIVDDLYSNRYLLEQILSEYKCTFAANGIQMWESLSKNVPDLILMDIGLPDTDGLTLVRRLKNDDRYKSIPVIFLTAHSSKTEIIEGMRAGGYDYILKPVDDVILLDRIKNALRKMNVSKMEPPAGDQTSDGGSA